MRHELILAVALCGMFASARGLEAQVIHQHAAAGGAILIPDFVIDDLAATEGTDGIHFQCTEDPARGIFASTYDLRGTPGNTTINNSNWASQVSVGSPNPSHPDDPLVAEWVVPYSQFPNGLPTGPYSFALGTAASVVSNTAHVTIAGDHVAPEVPGGFAANPALTTMTTLSLAWNLPADDATQVNITWNGGTTGWISASNPPARLVDHLSAGTTYWFTMTARDAAGNESQEGALLTGATLADPTAFTAGGAPGSGGGACSASPASCGGGLGLAMFALGLAAMRRLDR